MYAYSLNPPLRGAHTIANTLPPSTTLMQAKHHVKRHLAGQKVLALGADGGGHGGGGSGGGGAAARFVECACFQRV